MRSLELDANGSGSNKRKRDEEEVDENTDSYTPVVSWMGAKKLCDIMAHPLNTEQNIRSRAIDYLRIQSSLTQDITNSNNHIGSIRAEIDICDKTSVFGKDTIQRGINSLKNIMQTLVDTKDRMEKLLRMEYVPNLKMVSDHIHGLTCTPPEVNWLYRHSVAEIEMISATRALQSDLDSTAARAESLLIGLRFLHAIAEDLTPRNVY
jgi:hypothetical protein